MTQSAIPKPLRVIATILIIGGVISIVRTVIMLVTEGVGSNLVRAIPIVQIPIGLGLLHLKPAARWAALVWCGVIMAYAIGVIMILWGRYQPTTLQASRYVLFPIALAICVMAIWGYKILTRPAIAALFAPRA